MRRRTAALYFAMTLPATMALAADPAVAHGPTRQKLTQSVEIKAPADKVWALMGRFDDMSWHPVVTNTAGKGGNAVDATRVLTLGGGPATIDEVLTKYEPAQMRYAYRITAVDPKVLPVTNYSSTIAVTALGPDTSRVDWSGAFYRGYPNNDPPADLNEAAAIKAVTGVYQAGLQNLKKKLETGS